MFCSDMPKFIHGVYSRCRATGHELSVTFDKGVPEIPLHGTPTHSLKSTKGVIFAVAALGPLDHDQLRGKKERPALRISTGSAISKKLRKPIAKLACARSMFG